MYEEDSPKGGKKKRKRKEKEASDIKKMLFLYINILISGVVLISQLLFQKIKVLK